MEIISELKCPYCGKTLTSSEYNDAIEGFKKTAAEEYSKRFEDYKRGFEDQTLEQEKKHRVEIEYLKKVHAEHTTLIQEQLKNIQDRQIEDVRKRYDELSIQMEKTFNDKIQQILISQKKEVEEKENQMKLLRRRESQFQAEAIDAARVAAKNEILQKEQQISRFREKIESLEKQLKITQPELKGEAGELDLLNDLQKAFRQEGDVFSRQKRGTSQGDIIHQIRMPSGTLIETPIVYDNKEDTSITKKDREKARYYLDNHNTDYLIVVLNHLPKDISNGCIGQKDGILLVRRDIVVEVARQIRRSLVEISKVSASKEHQATKQSILYNYVISREFCRQIELICETDVEESEEQQKDEKYHQTLWKNKKARQAKRRNAYISISSTIDAIIQERSLNENSEEQNIMKMEPE